MFSASPSIGNQPWDFGQPHHDNHRPAASFVSSAAATARHQNRSKKITGCLLRLGEWAVSGEFHGLDFTNF
jgi:hypothetical protein